MSLSNLDDAKLSNLSRCDKQTLRQRKDGRYQLSDLSKAFDSVPLLI